MFQGPGAAPEVTFEPWEYLQCENLSSFEPQKNLFGKISDSFPACCGDGLEDFDPLLQFRTRAYPIRGSLPPERYLSAYVLRLRRLLAMPGQTCPSAFRHEGPQGGRRDATCLKAIQTRRRESHEARFIK